MGDYGCLGTPNDPKLAKKGLEFRAGKRQILVLFRFWPQSRPKRVKRSPRGTQGTQKGVKMEPKGVQKHEKSTLNVPQTPGKKHNKTRKKT